MTNLPVAVPVKLITREEAARIAEQCAQMLVEQFGARRVIPFGSVTGDAPWHSRSDIDLAVEGLPPELEAKAWATLDKLLPPGLEVDLIALESAPPELRARILGEVKMPKENIAALKLEAVIDPSLQSRLLEFLRFRHRIRHTYSYELEWPRVKRLAEELDELTQRVRAALEAFEANMDQAAGKRRKR
jgi:predicted nucleotidyltransferase